MVTCDALWRFVTDTGLSCWSSFINIHEPFRKGTSKMDYVTHKRECARMGAQCCRILTHKYLVGLSALIGLKKRIECLDWLDPERSYLKRILPWSFFGINQQCESALNLNRWQVVFGFLYR